MGVRRFLLSVIAVLCLIFSSRAQTAGEVMFVGFNADGTDGFAFVALVDIANGTNIHFNDNEWNELPIGGGGAFDGTGETEMTWQNNTGSAITAGTVITVTSSNTTPVVDVGTITTGTISLAATTEVLYMFLGADQFTPATFLSAIGNNVFNLANGSLVNTGLTSGTNALSIAGDEDIMVYLNNVNCNSTVAACASALANSSNWDTEDGAGDQSANAVFPDFPANVCDVAGTLFYPQTTYYSLASTAWDINTSWSLTSDGSSGAVPLDVWPRRTDNVVIRSGHTITVNAVDDNKSCGVSPDALGLSNVGPFTSSNTRMFYHTGDIIVDGTLTVSGIEMMTEGYTHLTSTGAFNLTSSYVNLGFLEADAGSTLSSADDLILAGNSSTIINTTSISNDDLIISFTDATLCGTGTTTLQNGAGSLITYANGATVAQICTDFIVDCTGVGCSGFFPVMGTGVVILGNTGPGGVAATNGTSKLVLWLDGNVGISVAGSVVTSWSDQSGYGNDANPLAAGNRPTLNSSALNGFPTVTFDGTDDVLNITDNASIDLTAWSFFMVTKVNLHKNYNAFFTKGNDQNENFEFLSNFPGTGDIHFPILYTDVTRSSDAETAGSMSNTTSGIFQYDYDNTNILMLKDLNQIFTRAETRTPQVNAQDLLVGNEAGTAGRNLNGDIAEYFAFNSAVNTTQRIIINNYLSAKYNIAVANDVYTMDNVGNGDYDFEVAGIGQAADGSNHRDARGTGVVRIWNPNGLDNSEFLMWGHDNSVITSTTTASPADVDGTVIEERLSRIWRVSESGGDVGSVSLSFDFNSIGGSPLGSNLRLLIDRDGDGFGDNDVTPIVGSVSAGIAVFSNVNFQDGDRFTLGNTDASVPLPVELVSFSVQPTNNLVLIDWATAAELNNDFFTVQRSLDAETWQEVSKVNGAGTIAEKQTYQVLDTKPHLGESYYRLKQTDFDGLVSFSSIERVIFNGTPGLVVHPNPSSGLFRLSGMGNMESSSVRVYNSIGRLVTPEVSHDSGELLIDLASYPQGVYILRVAGNQSLRSVRIIKR